jgi:DNA-directed RNA polymerase alpha subunit
VAQDPNKLPDEVRRLLAKHKAVLDTIIPSNSAAIPLFLGFLAETRRALLALTDQLSEPDVLLATPLEDLGFEPELYNFLAFDGVRTLGAITELTEPDLRRILRDNQEYIAAVKAMLKENKLQLRERSEQT